MKDFIVAVKKNKRILKEQVFFTLAGLTEYLLKKKYTKHDFLIIKDLLDKM